jgi:NADPH:quinone reductase
VTQGDTLLIHGGAGGVGLMAVQLARLRGARVIATASERNHDLLRELGAEPVAYGEGLADRVRALAPEGVDAGADLVGTDEALEVSLELVPDKARLATIANFQRAPQLGIAVLGGMDEAGQRTRTQARPRLLELAAQGKLQVHIAARYPLTEAAEAYRVLKQGHTVGKIVVVP